MSHRRLFISLAAVLTAGFIAFRLIPDVSPEQRAFGAALTQLASQFSPEGTRSPHTREHRSFSTTIEVLRAEGLPKQLQSLKADLAIAPPDRLRVATTVDDSPFIAGRNGNEIWTWQPQKNFALQAVSGVPLFASDPATLDDTRLGPISLPFDAAKLQWLANLCEVEALPDELIDGLTARVLQARLGSTARKILGRSDAVLTLWLRPDGFPLRMGYREGDKTDLLIALHDTHLDAPVPATTWELPAPQDTKVERVALHHIHRFLTSAPVLLNKPKVPTLGPSTGKVEIVAESGRGRLELHDGTRVLFLAGTPEEMGAQHGALLADEARNLVSRILYGVGVGSSFAKGAWFFGTIEECQSRIAPFVDSRYTREMDALADAAGVRREEARLANFFPELFHCSGFALTGSATKGGRIYHGRVLDYMKGVGLEPNAVVMVMQPDQGHAWVNIGYAGFIGSVTAMNAAQISIGEMGGRGEGNWDGKPMAQLMREVMEKAGTLEEAIAIMRDSPRTCEYYYVIADGKTREAVGIKATHDLFEVVKLGEPHPQLDSPIADTVLLSSGDRYRELVNRVKQGFGTYDADSARDLMTRPVCMTSNIQSVLFAPDTLDFWVANADNHNVASHTRYTHYNLAKLLVRPPPPSTASR